MRAPSYLERRGTPGSVEELAAHDGLTYAYSSTPRVWRLIGAGGRVHEVRVAGKLHANSGEALRSAAMAGLGLIYEPDFLLADPLRRGQLVRVLPEFAGATGDIWAVYPSRRHLSLKVRLFVDHVAQAFATFETPGGAGHSAPQQ